MAWVANIIRDRGRFITTRLDIFYFIPFLTILFFLLPIAAGLFFVIAGAFGLDAAFVVQLPQGVDLPVLAFFSRAGLWHSIAFTFWVGMCASLLAWGFTCFLLAFANQNRLFQIVQKLLSPILSIPHITLAVGLLFLFAPSGMIARMLALPLGWEQPPLWNSNPDPYGLLLILGLVMKEVPFLFLLSLPALERIGMKNHILAGQILGYSPAAAFFKLIYPLLYQQMRLPIFVVLAFSLSNVEMALILAPHAPVLLGVKILQWARHPDLSELYFAASGAFWICLLILFAIAAWEGSAKLLKSPYRFFSVSGGRGTWLGRWQGVGQSLTLTLCSLLILLSIAAIILLVIWSMTGLWPFPDLLPDKMTWRYWAKSWQMMQFSLPLTLLIALSAAFLSMILAIGCLEAEERHGFRLHNAGMFILYLPLLIPQISFLFGVQILLLRLDWLGRLSMVIMAHMLFVLPYIYLSLSGGWRKLNPHYRLTAYTLGKSPNQTLFRLILPLQFSALLTAFALGVAVSVALYLPTYLIGGGRYVTLTTEAIVLSSGGNRRIVSIYGLMQAIVPLAFFSLAIFLPRFLYRDRMQMNVRT